jgi:hypothetical protein
VLPVFLFVIPQGSAVVFSPATQTIVIFDRSGGQFSSSVAQWKDPGKFFCCLLLLVLNASSSTFETTEN